MIEFDPNSLTETETNFLKKAKSAGATADQAFKYLQSKKPAQPTGQAPMELPKTATVQKGAPFAPIQISPEQIQKTGELPQGVSPEQANQAIQNQRLSEGAPVLKQEEKTVMDEIGIRFGEAGDELSPQDKFIAKNIIPLVVGGGTGLLAKGALKAAPWFAELAAASPRIASIISGAVEGVGFEVGMKGAEGELPTAKGIAGSAALFGGIPAAGAVVGAGKELLGKAIPETLIKSAIKLKPTQKIRVAEELAKMGENTTAETAEQYLLKNRISGSPDEVAKQLATKAKEARAAKLESLSPLTNKFKDAKIGQFADEVVKATDGVSGVEEVASKARDLQKAVKSKQGATLAQIDELKTLFDQNLNVFTLAGSVKEGVTKKGLANLRGYTKTFIEDAANKLGVSNIKQLNQDVIINRSLSRAITGQAVGAGGNALAKLSDLLIGGSVIGGGIAAGGFDKDNLIKSGLTAVGVVAGAKFFSPANRIKLANWLSKNLNEGEAGIFLKVMQGDRAGLDTKLTEKIRNGFKEMGAKLEPIKNTKGFIDPGAIKEDIGKAFNKASPAESATLTKEAGKSKMGGVDTKLATEAKKYKSADEFGKIISEDTPTNYISREIGGERISRSSVPKELLDSHDLTQLNGDKSYYKVGDNYIELSLDKWATKGGDKVGVEGIFILNKGEGLGTKVIDSIQEWANANQIEFVGSTTIKTKMGEGLFNKSKNQNLNNFAKENGIYDVNSGEIKIDLKKVFINKNIKENYTPLERFTKQSNKGNDGEWFFGENAENVKNTKTFGDTKENFFLDKKANIYSEENFKNKYSPSSEKYVIDNNLTSKKLESLETSLSKKPSQKTMKEITWEQQKLAKDDLNSRGYDGVRWIYEEQAAPLQFNIWNKDVIKTKSQLTDIWEQAKGGAGFKPGATPSKLATEAKKYKSADEFVKSQGKTVYHGTSLENANKIKSEGFKIGGGKGVSGETSSDFIYATENKVSANKYVSDRLGIKNPTVVTGDFNGKVLEIQGKMADFEAFGEASRKLGVPLGRGSQGGLTMLDMPAIKKAMQEQGYGAIRFSDRYANGTKAMAILPDSIYTKSQLKDIWKQANK